MYVEIRGIEQWIQYGGAPEAPILLYLHGGPGGTSVPAAEACGAGRTFARNGEAGCGRLTIDRMVTDGLEVVFRRRPSSWQRSISRPPERLIRNSCASRGVIISSC